MEDEAFQNLLDEILDSLPEEFKSKLTNVAIRYQDWPSDIQLKKARVTKGLLLGLYEGVPNAKGGYYRIKLPDTITLFKIPLQMVSRSILDFTQRVRDTLLHEIAHHFGMNEDEVREAEANRQHH